MFCAIWETFFYFKQKKMGRFWIYYKPSANTEIQIFPLVDAYFDTPSICMFIGMHSSNCAW